MRLKRKWFLLRLICGRLRQGGCLVVDKILPVRRRVRLLVVADLCFVFFIRVSLFAMAVQMLKA